MPSYVQRAVTDVLVAHGLPKLSHSLHLTVSTNHTTKEAARYEMPSTRVPFWVGGKIVMSSKMYETDPLQAWIIPAGIALTPALGFSAHVSTHYFTGNSAAPPYVIVPAVWGTATPLVANTESMEPRDWFVYEDP